MARKRSFKFDNDSKKFFVNEKEVSDGSTVSANLTTTAQSNITSVGTLTSISITGNATIGGTLLQYGKLTVDVPTAATSTTTGARVITGGAGIGGNVHAANLTATNGVYGTIRTAAQASITSVGTLAGLTVSDDIVPNANATIHLGSTSSRFANIWGSTFRGTSVTAQYADLAEIYRSDRNYIPGTVVVFGGTSEVTVSLTSHDTKVAGVVSTNPAYLMNDREDGSAVALQGRVPCRVLGPVVKGDRVVTSDVRGVAERLDMTK